MIKIEEFRDYLKIDKLALDEALTQQAELFYEVAEGYAIAVAVRDKCKEDAAIVDATLDADVRRRLESKKPTEAMIKSAIQTDPQHFKATKDYLDAKLEAEKWGALKEAFTQRASMLKELAHIYVTRYYDTDSVKDTPVTDRMVYHRQRQKLAHD